MKVYDDGFATLLAYQDAWNSESAEIGVAEKARRIGLSWGDGAARVIHAAQGAGNVYYMSYNRDMTETFITDCADWAKWFGGVAGAVSEDEILLDGETSRRFRIDFDSGRSIIALVSHPRVLRSKGRPGDIVIVDEAAFCDDLDELLKAAVAVTQWGGCVRIISTHNGDESAFNELIVDIRAGRLPYALHRVTLDDAIECGLARRICSVKGDRWHEGYAAEWRAAQIAKYRDHDAMLEELFCVPRRGAGAYFTRVLVESRMFDAPVLRFNGSAEFNGWPEPMRRLEMEQWLQENVLPLLADLDPDRRHAIGGDFARTGDLSVYAPLEIGETLKRTCPLLLEMRNVPHLQQVQAVRYVCDRLPRFSAGAFDATGNGSFLAEAMVDAYGSIIEPVMLTESWYRENMPRYKAAFEDDRIALPRSDDVVEDHRAIQLVRGVPRLPQGKTGAAGDRHGDSAIAGALGWYASEQSGGPIEFDSAGRRETASGMDAYLGEHRVFGRGNRFEGYI